MFAKARGIEDSNALKNDSKPVEEICPRSSRRRTICNGMGARATNEKADVLRSRDCGGLGGAVRGLAQGRGAVSGDAGPSCVQVGERASRHALCGNQPVCRRRIDAWRSTRRDVHQVTLKAAESLAGWIFEDKDTLEPRPVWTRTAPGALASSRSRRVPKLAKVQRRALCIKSRYWCTRRFFTKSFLGDDDDVPAGSVRAVRNRHRHAIEQASHASMAWRSSA